MHGRQHEAIGQTGRITHVGGAHLRLAAGDTFKGRREIRQHRFDRREPDLQGRLTGLRPALRLNVGRDRRQAESERKANEPGQSPVRVNLGAEE
jgi:hypothetical protein